MGILWNSLDERALLEILRAQDRQLLYGNTERCRTEWHCYASQPVDSGTMEMKSCSLIATLTVIILRPEHSQAVLAAFVPERLSKVSSDQMRP